MIATAGCRSRRSASSWLPDAAGAVASAYAFASGNSEISRGLRGINQQPAAMVARVNSTSSRIAAGDQIVVLSGMTPVVDSRKCPGVATNSGGVTNLGNFE